MEPVQTTIDTKTDLKPRYEALVSERQGSIETLWDDVDRYVDPMGSSRSQSKSAQESGVEWKRVDIWDGTAIIASEKLAANMQGGIVPTSSQWLRLGYGQAALKSSVEAQTYLDEITQILWSALQASDFQKEIGRSFLDLVRPGTTFLSAEPVDPDVYRGIDFRSWAVREAYFEEGPQGEPERVFRRLAWTPVQILSHFRGQMARYGEDIIPERIRRAAKTPSGGTERIEVIYCVWQRHDVQRQMAAKEDLRGRIRRAKRRSAMENLEYSGPAEPEEERELAPHLRPYGGVYFEASSGERIGCEDGYYEMPVVVGRFSVTSGSKWGHGPTAAAMPTIKYLNAYLEAVLTASEKGIDPPMMTTLRGLMGDLDMRPSALNVVDDIEGLKPLHPAGRLDIAYQFVQLLQQKVESYYRTDQLDLKDSPQMSATEAQIREDRVQRSVGPTQGAIQDDVISKIVKICLGILSRQGQLPPKPPFLEAWEKQTGQSVELVIEYMGPFARAQRTDQVASIERLASFAAGLLKMGFQDTALVFSPIKSLRKVSEMLGAPADCLESDDAVAKAKREQAEMQRAAMEAEVAAAQGKAMRDQAAAAVDLQGLPVPAAPTPMVNPPLQEY